MGMECRNTSEISQAVLQLKEMHNAAMENMPGFMQAVLKTDVANRCKFDADGPLLSMSMPTQTYIAEAWDVESEEPVVGGATLSMAIPPANNGGNPTLLASTR